MILSQKAFFFFLCRCSLTFGQMYFVLELWWLYLEICYLLTLTFLLRRKKISFPEKIAFEKSVLNKNYEKKCFSPIKKREGQEAAVDQEAGHGQETGTPTEWEPQRPCFVCIQTKTHYREFRCCLNFITFINETLLKLAKMTTTVTKKNTGTRKLPEKMSGTKVSNKMLP